MLKNIIIGYKTNELPDNLIDFLPVIKKGESDTAILQTWMTHFEQAGIPYAVTERNGIKTLWKERMV